MYDITSSFVIFEHALQRISHIGGRNLTGQMLIDFF
jgi:hypothetical protein